MTRAGLIAGLLMLLTACAGQEADIPAIESEIGTGIEDQAGQPVTVDCPSTIDWEVGRTFNCVVEASDGTRAMAEVTMENEDGDVTWQVN